MRAGNGKTDNQRQTENLKFLHGPILRFVQQVDVQRAATREVPKNRPVVLKIRFEPTVSKLPRYVYKKGSVFALVADVIMPRDFANAGMTRGPSRRRSRPRPTINDGAIAMVYQTLVEVLELPQQRLLLLW